MKKPTFSARTAAGPPPRKSGGVKAGKKGQTASVVKGKKDKC